MCCVSRQLEAMGARPGKRQSWVQAWKAKAFIWWRDEISSRLLLSCCETCIVAHCKSTSFGFPYAASLSEVFRCHLGMEES